MLVLEWEQTVCGLATVYKMIDYSSTQHGWSGMIYYFYMTTLYTENESFSLDSSG